MSSQSAAGRREAAIAAAAKLGPMKQEVEDAIAQQRANYAERRAARGASEAKPVERRLGQDRRTGDFDRRQGERRFQTMDDKLASVDDRQNLRRFTGGPISGFGNEV